MRYLEPLVIAIIVVVSIGISLHVSGDTAAQCAAQDPPVTINRQIPDCVSFSASLDALEAAVTKLEKTTSKLVRKPLKVGPAGPQHNSRPATQ